MTRRPFKSTCSTLSRAVITIEFQPSLAAFSVGASKSVHGSNAVLARAAGFINRTGCRSGRCLSDYPGTDEHAAVALGSDSSASTKSPNRCFVQRSPALAWHTSAPPSITHPGLVFSVARLVQLEALPIKQRDPVVRTFPGQLVFGRRLTGGERVERSTDHQKGGEGRDAVQHNFVRVGLLRSQQDRRQIWIATKRHKSHKTHDFCGLCAFLWPIPDWAVVVYLAA